MTSTHDSKTPGKEIHPEQEKREQAAERLHEMKQGELPSNTEIKKGLDAMDKKLVENHDQLSTAGQQVAQDVRNLIGTAKTIVDEKNKGEVLQSAYYHQNRAAAHTDQDTGIKQLRQFLTSNFNVDKNKTKAEAKENIQSMGTIVRLLITSQQFRNFANRFVEFISQIYKVNKNAAKPHATYQDPHNLSYQQNSLNRVVNDHHEGHTGVAGQQAHVVESHPAKTDSHGQPIITGNIPTREEEKLLDELVALLNELHSHPQYRNAISYIADTSERLTDILKEKKGNAQELKSLKANVDDQAKYHQEVAKQDARQILENWIGDDYSLDRLLKNVEYIQAQTKTDPELKSLLHDTREFLTKSAKDDAYVRNEDKVRHDARDLLHRHNQITFGKYRQETNHIIKELRYIFRQLQTDDSVQDLKNVASDLKDHILMGADGKPVLKPELLNDAQTIIRSLLEAIKYIPIPPIHQEDEKMELQLENIVLKTSHVTPSNVSITAHMDASKGQNDNYFEVNISKIYAKLRSVNFYMHKKTGFPKIEDRGLADIDLTRYPGMTISMQIAPNTRKVGNNVHSVFKVRNAHCSISKLNIRLRDTNHDTLYKLVSPIINAVARKRIENAIVENINHAVDKLNDVASRQASTVVDKTQQAKDKAEQKADEKGHRVGGAYDANHSNTTGAHHTGATTTTTTTTTTH